MGEGESDTGLGLQDGRRKISLVHDLDNSSYLILPSDRYAFISGIYRGLSPVSGREHAGLTRGFHLL